MLSSDELGEKGESRFKEICADASLICNKSDRDRTGWDFLVEFPLDNKSTINFDKREVPISCHFQIKTIYSTTKKISVRLTAAERLAKEPKPTFIYVLKVDQSLNFTDAYLIHIWGDRLGSILKRLRKEEKLGTDVTEINKKKISLTPSESEKIELSGDALSKGLRKLCEAGMHAYIVEKNKHVKSLGFEGSAYQGKFTITAENADKISDIFLGLEKEVSVDVSESYENRFGIPLPIPQWDQSGAKITIQPNPIDSCSVFFKDNLIKDWVVFPAKIYTTPANLPEFLRKILIDMDDIKITMSSSREGSIKYKISFDGDGGEIHPIKFWKKLWMAALVVSSGDGEIILSPEKISAPIALPLSGPNRLYPIDYCKSIVDVLDRVEKILFRLSVSPDKLFDIDKVLDKSDQIIFISMLSTGELRDFYVTLQCEVTMSMDREEKMILSNILEIDDIFIASYGVADFSYKANSGTLKVEAINFIFKEMKRVKNIHEYEEFKNSLKDIEKMEIVEINYH